MWQTCWNLQVEAVSFPKLHNILYPYTCEGNDTRMRSVYILKKWNFNLHLNAEFKKMKQNLRTTDGKIDGFNDRQTDRQTDRKTENRVFLN